MSFCLERERAWGSRKREQRKMRYKLLHLVIHFCIQSSEGCGLLVGTPAPNKCMNENQAKLASTPDPLGLRREAEATTLCHAWCEVTKQAQVDTVLKKFRKETHIIPFIHQESCLGEEINTQNYRPESSKQILMQLLLACSEKQQCMFCPLLPCHPTHLANPILHSGLP